MLDKELKSLPLVFTRVEIVPVSYTHIDVYTRQAYNIGFKEDIDYVMYIIVVNSERAEELSLIHIS